MQLPCYLDEHLSFKTALVARQLGLDVTSAQELGHRGWSDEQQLLWAAHEGRCFVPGDVRDLRRLTSGFLAKGWPHAGVLLVPPALPDHDFAGIAEALLAYMLHVHEPVPPYFLDYLRPVR